jgi:hypothetical protein
MGYEVIDTIKGAANPWGRDVGRPSAHATFVRMAVRLRRMFLLCARRFVTFRSASPHVKALSVDQKIKSVTLCKVRFARASAELPWSSKIERSARKGTLRMSGPVCASNQVLSIHRSSPHVGHRGLSIHRSFSGDVQSSQDQQRPVAFAINSVSI